MIRAKFVCNWLQDGAGSLRTLNLSAVYEGNADLQRLTENAIFGEATPSGFLSLSGPGLGDFETGEEYYLDLVRPDVSVIAERYIVSLPIKLAYRNVNLPGENAQYRFVQHHSLTVREAVLTMGVNNPAAIQTLDAHMEWRLCICKAVGRRSDAEIELRKKALAEAEAYVASRGSTMTDAHTEAYLSGFRKKLARAEGKDA